MLLIVVGKGTDHDELLLFVLSSTAYVAIENCIFKQAQ